MAAKRREGGQGDQDEARGAGVEAEDVPARDEEEEEEEGCDVGGLEEPAHLRGLVEAEEPPGPEEGEGDRDGREQGEHGGSTVRRGRSSGAADHGLAA
jgi:hypothetical protein